MKLTRSLALSALLLAATGQVAGAISYPKFDSGPAVVARNVQTTELDSTTVIFGRQGATFSTIARQGNNTVWMWGPSEEISLAVPGGFDSDPAATYIRNTADIMICGHSAASPGHFYCSIGTVDYQDRTTTSHIRFPVTYTGQAGPGTFYPGTNPAIVLVGTSTVYLFGIGQDGYIWYATANVSGVPTWNGWWRIPGSPSNGGFSANLSAVATDANGGIEICSSNTIEGTLCDKLDPSIGWTGWFNTQLPGPASFYRYALTRASDGIWLVGVGSPDTHEFGTSSTDGVHWSPLIQMGAGYQFLSRQAVRATPASANLLSVGRGGDSVFWYNISSSSGWTAIGF